LDKSSFLSLSTCVSLNNQGQHWIRSEVENTRRLIRIKLLQSHSLVEERPAQPEFCQQTQQLCPERSNISRSQLSFAWNCICLFELLVPPNAASPARFYICAWSDATALAAPRGKASKCQKSERGAHMVRHPAVSNTACCR
jgi:hypothetical protein